MKAWAEIERIAAEIMQDIHDGHPPDTFKLGLIIRIAQEQAKMETLK
jgi:hypothetical protein